MHMVLAILVILGLCLLEPTLLLGLGWSPDYQTALLATAQPALMWGLAGWGAAFIARAFSGKDWWLLGFLAAAMTQQCLGRPAAADTETCLLLFGVALGRGASGCLSEREAEAKIRGLLLGLIFLLALLAWWPACPANNSYHGPRWKALWDNPNLYGMLVGAGIILACGLRQPTAPSPSPAQARHQVIISPVWSLLLPAATLILSVGLIMSYSRGAWLGVLAGLMYLGWHYGKIKRRQVLLAALAAGVAVFALWRSTTENLPWYFQRLDFSRPSAQHRVLAWQAACRMMYTFPMGVGWHNAVPYYAQNYSPPANTAGALNTNDYLIVGTELGLPALLLFMTYVGLCLRGKCAVQSEAGRLQAACRGATLVFVITFWFDGGLFKLPAAALFWLLLELGAARPAARPHSLFPVAAHGLKA